MIKRNRYKYLFHAECPSNGLLIQYELSIETHRMIDVFEIQKITDRFDRGFQEEFADALYEAFMGHQVMRADHHGFSIVTVRSEEESHTVLGWNPYPLDRS